MWLAVDKKDKKDSKAFNRTQNMNIQYLFLVCKQSVDRKS